MRDYPTLHLDRKELVLLFYISQSLFTFVDKHYI